jgi:hypothetical protein
MSQFKDDLALNCGFYHQGGAMSTIASAVLETKLQFPFTHPGSSFLGLFSEKQIPSSSGRLSTPWVQLNFQQKNITLLNSNEKVGKESSVKVYGQKKQKKESKASGFIRIGRLQGCAGLTQTGRTGIRYPGKQPKRIGIVEDLVCKDFPCTIRPSLFFPFRELSCEIRKIKK